MERSEEIDEAASLAEVGWFMTARPRLEKALFAWTSCGTAWMKIW